MWATVSLTSCFPGNGGNGCDETGNNRRSSSCFFFNGEEYQFRCNCRVWAAFTALAIFRTWRCTIRHCELPSTTIAMPRLFKILLRHYVFVAGVPWSNRMRIDRHCRTALRRGRGRSIETAGRELQHGTICSRVTSNHSIISSMVAPDSRFSNTVDTGIRVSLNTHAPLTLPGMLSTVGHWEHSSIACFHPVLIVAF